MSHKVGGLIWHYELENWWFTTFTAREREQIDSLYRPFEDPHARVLTHGRPLTAGTGMGPARWRELPEELRQEAGTAASLLTGLANRLNRPGYRHLALKVITEAGRRAVAERNVLDLHFVYQAVIQIYYREYRDSQAHNANALAALNMVIKACEKMIALGPQALKAFHEQYPDAPAPGHHGFYQLAKIRREQGNLEESLRLQREAAEQGWDIHIELRSTPAP